MHKATELFHKTGQEENQGFGSGGVVYWVIVLRVFLDPCCVYWKCCYIELNSYKISGKTNYIVE